MAALVTGVDPALQRRPTEAGGWLARTQSSFPSSSSAAASPSAARI
ncbi:MAG: hypothetical protein WDN49_21710 [Acetobacteraceae bacterium]